MKNNAKLLGKEIRNKRLRLNLTMDYVAKEAGITRATLTSIEKGQGNCSINSYINVMNYLNLSLNIVDNTPRPNRQRATRSITVMDKKINSFIVMCIEEYAAHTNKDSGTTYKLLKEKGLIKLLNSYYEDYHGMGMEEIMQEFDYALGV